MLTEITLESGCKSTTFYNTIQIIQKENSKKKQLFYSTNGKINQKNNFTYLYYIGTKEKEYPLHKIYKKIQIAKQLFPIPLHSETT